LNQIIEQINKLIELYDESEVISAFILNISPELNFNYPFDINPKLNSIVNKLIQNFLEKFTLNDILSTCMNYLVDDDEFEDDEFDDDEFEDDEEFILDEETEIKSVNRLDIGNVRVFNLGKNMRCFTCNAHHDMLTGIQYLLYFHFDHLQQFSSDVCEFCEFGVPEIHKMEMKCKNCDTVYLFTLTNNNQQDPRKSWLIELNSFEYLNVISDFDPSSVHSREFNIKIVENLDTISTTCSFEPKYGEIHDNMPPSIECNEEMHFYLCDVARNRLIDTGPIYCPSCDAFSSESSINRRTKKYQQSKRNCYHDYLTIMEKNDMLGFICPRC